MFAARNRSSFQRGREHRWARCSQAVAWLAVVASLAQFTAAPRAVAQIKPATATLKAYTVPAGELQTIASDLKRTLSGPGVRVSTDARTSQLLVVGPTEVHQEIAARLAAGTLGKSSEPIDPNLHTLRHVSWKEFEGQLRRVGFVAETSLPNADPARYQLRTPRGAEAHVAVARSEGKVKVAATAQLAPAMRQLAETLDRPATRPGETAQLVTFDRADPATVTRLLNYLQSAARPTNPASGKHQHIGEYVSLLFQPPPPPVAPPGPPAVPVVPVVPVVPGAAPEGAPAEGADPNDPGPEAFGSVNNVRIEYIEGLDVLILTGRKPDVDRVMKLIEQIEAQSQTTRPEVEVFHLRHVDGRALNDLLTQIYDQVFTARQGRVTIVSLIKPNALLLIGRKENLPPVKELIEKLDRPINGDTELRVFPLKRVLAADAETKLEALFTPTTGPGAPTGQGTGLSTRVNIISDARTNSLIVQASPRDLVEVAKLLDTLDGAISEKRGDIRIIKLRNSLADELVPVIQEAIGGQSSGGGNNNQPVQGPGAITTPPGGGGANASGGTQGRSLQMVQVGGQTLQSGILSDMQITSDPRGNSIIITGPPENMDLIEALIRQLDELPATEAQIKVFTIVNGDATQLADLLRQLFGQSTGTQGGNQGLQALLQTATGGGDSALVPLRFSVDVRTNSIVASGSTGDLNVVYKVLVRLDEGNIRERITTVYRLRNAPATEVANSLQLLRQQQQQLNQIAPTLNSAPQTLEKEVIVVPEAVSNSLIVSATPRYFDEIRRVVEELDRRPNMVIIQVLLAEVSLNDLNEFGIELGLQDSLLFDRGVAGIPTGTPRVGFPFNTAAIGNDNTAASLATRENVAAQALSNLSVGRTNATAGFGGLVLSAGNESVNVLIRALQQSQRMQVLSRPQVQTLDNQPAYVQVGQQVPYITSSNQTQFGIQNQTTFQDVGVILGVTPRTSPDGMIVMEIDAVKSDLGPEAEGIAISVSANGTAIRQPIINVTRAQTTVSARSGQTVILGGLITRNQSETTRRVPYLADIPVLGRLFRFDSVNVERTELLIIMTPYVMRTDEHVAWLNMRESERLHWCLADVANVHGQAQHFTSSGDSGISTPTIYPDETPAPEGLIAPESSAPRDGAGPSQWPNVPVDPANTPQYLPVPGDPNYNPTPVPRMSPPGNLPIPPQTIPPQPIPTSAPSNGVPNPPATPDQSNYRPQPANQLRTSQPQPNQASGAPVHSGHSPSATLRPMGPLQALPPVPQGPVGQPQMVTAPAPAFVPPYGPPQLPAYPQPQLGTQPPPGAQPAGYQQQPPGQVAPAVYTPRGPNPQYTPVAR